MTCQITEPIVRSEMAGRLLVGDPTSETRCEIRRRDHESAGEASAVSDRESECGVWASDVVGVKIERSVPAIQASCADVTAGSGG
jgi:hypothetical protein